MVKIPGLDDLKKMGTGLIDSAKSVKLSEVVDKVKSGIETVSGKGGGNIPQGDEALKVLFEGLHASLKELLEAEAAQQMITKKIQSQLSDLGRIINMSQQSGNPGEPNP